MLRICSCGNENMTDFNDQYRKLVKGNAKLSDLSLEDWVYCPEHLSYFNLSSITDVVLVSKLLALRTRYLKANNVPVLAEPTVRKVELEMIPSLPIVVSSPSNLDSSAGLNNSFAVFVRKPLSIDLASISNPMLVNVENLPFCPSLGNDEYIGVLPLDETTYCPHFSAHSLSGARQCTSTPGVETTAQTLYPGAFGKRRNSVSLSRSCEPDFAMRTTDPARMGENGKWQPIPEVAILEMNQYVAIAMVDSYFSHELWPDHRLYYAAPPLGSGGLGSGPMGMLFLVEWIGVLFYSIISEPFFTGSPKQAKAKELMDEIEATRGSAYQNPLKIHRRHEVYTASNKQGVGWGKLDNETFIKIIEAPYLLKPAPAGVEFDKTDVEYRKVIGEEATADGHWRKNAVFFLHLHKVMAVWQQVWAVEAVGEDAVHRAVFVPFELLYGEFSVCLKSPWIGDDADESVMEDEDLLKSVVEAVLWLARRWSLLYIDLRLPNLRWTEGEDGSEGHLVIMDYDDMVILKQKPCCDWCTYGHLKGNAHMRDVWASYRTLAELFESTVSGKEKCELCRN